MGTIINYYKVSYYLIIIYTPDYIYICIYIYILNCLCGSVAKSSGTQAVGNGFEPRPDH